MSGQFPEAAAPQGLVIVVAATAHEPAGWEASVIRRLRASGTSRVIVRAPEAMRLPGKPGDAPDGAQQVSGPLMSPVAIVDLTGELDTGWRGHAVEGMWRLCDGRGLPPGDPHHGLETHANGAGIVLELVAWKDAGVFLLDTARGYAEPCEKIPQERLAVMGASLLDGALREIRALGGLAARAPWPGERRAHARPAAWQRLLWRTRALAAHAAIQVKGFLLVEHWMIGLVDMTFAEAVRAQRLTVRWLGTRADSHCWADPFGVPGRPDEIYCEEVDLRRGLGRIVRLKLGAHDAPSAAGPIDLGLPGHLSFPYLFRHDGALYCVAESSQSRRCVLNRQDESGGWRQVAVLLEDVAAVDPTIFEHEGRFWLLYTDVAMGQFDNVCLCHADNLLGPWQPHAQNPVRFDNGSARAAGSVVRAGGQLLRVAQVCKSGYGQAIAVNRIVHCTPEFYREETVGRISPESDRLNPDGLHTLSDWGDRVVVDGKRHLFRAGLLWHRIVARAGRALRLPAPTRNPSREASRR
ncbi:glucosamine inositolphosphorylceramide transferase family protein [Cupriavidus oxalaticus]|uniref:glucosamine inositolphosphorylceramide transferase family protein n=1 Tax=Cupriavidus oxalaticus TaxID=96344 RepID=UPI00317C72B9